MSAKRLPVPALAARNSAKGIVLPYNCMSCEAYPMTLAMPYAAALTVPALAKCPWVNPRDDNMFGDCVRGYFRAYVFYSLYISRYLIFRPALLALLALLSGL